MAAQERYERREVRRPGAAGEVEQVRHVSTIGSVGSVGEVTPLPARTAPPSATNVNVAQRAAAVPAGAVVDAAPPAPAGSARYAVAKANQLLWFACAVLELLLALRVVLRMVGASAAAPFVAFVYGVTQPLAGPFLGMLPNQGGAAGAAGRGAVLEVPTLIAMLVYFLVFLLLTYLLRLLVSRPSTE